MESTEKSKAIRFNGTLIYCDAFDPKKISNFKRKFEEILLKGESINIEGSLIPNPKFGNEILVFDIPVDLREHYPETLRVFLNSENKVIGKIIYTKDASLDPNHFSGQYRKYGNKNIVLFGIQELQNQERNHLAIRVDIKLQIQNN
jgi:hypothetical protein